MYAAREYEIEERTKGRIVVVRLGPQDGKRIINTYTNREAAQKIADLLDELKDQEF